MKIRVLITFLLPAPTANAGGGATGQNGDVLIAFCAFVVITAFSFAVPWLKRYLVKRFRLLKKE